MPAFKRHKTGTSDSAWDGPANKTRVKEGQSRAYYGKIFGWYDPDGDEGVKKTYKFIHHEVAGDGNPGAANLTACSTGIGVLNGGRGGTTIPEADRQGVYNHLAGHLRDADKEVPELNSAQDRRETRTLHLSELRLEERSEGESPIITGYAAVFNQYSEVLFWFREIIRPGAFRQSIARDDIRALWNHNPDKVLGRTKNGTLKLEEDNQGLKVTISPPEWAAAEVESIRRGDVDQMSFGFETLEDEWTKDEQGFMQRELVKVNLFDVSPVTFPAYPQTTVAVRSKEPKTEEKALPNPEPWRKSYREREIQIGGSIS